MPGFVKTKKDEARWSKAKEAAGKSTQKETESYWKLANYIYHKMGKTEEDIQKSEMLKKDLLAPPKPTTAIKSPMKMGSTAVKMPKIKKLAGALDKPSLFFKSESFEQVKHPSVRKLRDFLVNNRTKK